MMPAVLVGLLVAVAAWFVARPLVAAGADAAGGGAGGGGAGGRGTTSAGTRRRTVVALAAATAAVCAGVLMARAVAPTRTTSGAPARAAAAVATPSAPASAPASARADAPTSAQAPPNQLTDEQLAAISTALTRVRAKPRDVAAHLDLARAYAGADQAQLSTVEYLAVLRLDKANPEANSALALVALAAGKPTEGKRLVDAVLAAHPRYPDALYTRGLIYLMGLHRAAPGVRDLRAYLEAAPYGSHRPAVETLLAMVSDGRTP
jgi:hypothetical protein